MVRIHLKTSKCDQFGRGADIFLGRTGDPVCPVAAVLAFMVIRGTRPSPLFKDETGKTIVKSWFVAQIRDVLRRIGLPQD